MRTVETRFCWSTWALSLAGLLALAACVNQPPAAAPVVQAPGTASGPAAPGVAATSPSAAPALGAKPAPATKARNAFVLLSGGGTPLSNNYSQFLQARAIEAFFARRYPTDPTWVFFGIGNRPGETPVLADARRQLKHGDLLVESWLPGLLPRNRPATRESFLTALRDEILPTVRDGGTLFLFIGDHGSITRGREPEATVTMWQLKQNAPGSTGWSTDPKQELTVSDLRTALAEGLGKGRVVFCMTQCHSGGFHYLSVPREIAPPAAWFTVAPAGAARWAPAPLLPIAGFAATDEESLAAGCDPDPDPEKWAGYERFVPESLLGLDLFTLEPAGAGMHSFAEAHEAAMLVDPTIDKPRATSEQFLERWAQTIEKLAARPQGLSPEAAGAVRAFTRAVDTGRVQVADARVRAKAAEFERYTARLIQQNGAVKDLLLNGTRRQLEQAIRQVAVRPPAPATTPPPPATVTAARGGRGPANAARTAWRDVLRPAWKTAVLAGRVPALPAAALDFEKRLLELEDGGRDLMSGAGGAGPLLNEIYWRSGYAFPARLDRAKAEAVALWAVERRRVITEWARASTDDKIKLAAEMFAGGVARRPVAAGPVTNAATASPAPTPTAVTTTTAASAPGANVSTRPLSRRTAAERVLFFRRTLAAWECLVTLGEQAALAQLDALIELERTPLPAPTPAS